MPKSKSRATGKPIRPRPTNPVIAGRVPPSLHQKIKQAAKASGRTMSEEMAYRVALTFETVPLRAADYSLGSPSFETPEFETAVEAAVERVLRRKQGQPS